MTALHEAWTALRHGGNLLSSEALDKLPDPKPPRYGLADRLRSALVDFDPEKPKGPAMGALLDVVLEDAAGSSVGWRKGSSLGAADAEKLLDGTVLKPRRLWEGPAGEAMAVFTDVAPRLGVGRGRRPVARVTEYLRRRGTQLGLLTNGQQWRLIWADTDATAWVEWDAERWLDADQFSDELLVMRRLLSWAALTRSEADRSPLLQGIRDTRRGQANLSKELGERVRRAVETLLKARAPVVGPAWEEHDSADLYVAASHFVMRLVVILFAEARELLPVDNPVYHHAYGLRGLIDQLDRLTPERRRARQMAWPRLLALFRLLHEGSHHQQLMVNAYGGELFASGDAPLRKALEHLNKAGKGEAVKQAIALLNDPGLEGNRCTRALELLTGNDDGEDGPVTRARYALRNDSAVQRALALLEALPEPPDDDTVHTMLVLLTRTSQRVREGAGWRRVAAPVDFTELTSEYIGILYEGLLDYELHRAGEHPVVFLNLGDQPALPMDRLEEMDDKALKALVEKAKVKKKAANDDDDGVDDRGEEGPEAQDDEDDSSEDEDGPEGADEDETGPDDARAIARDRARIWGRRAAELAKLVKKPKGRLTPAKQADYDAQLDSAAAQLVADIKLPGELYLVRWGGTRKGAGTFYTRPQLTLPTVRRTLEPLLSDEEGTIRTPELLLALKVCDPAMGSGSFLVAALRVLTTSVIEALHEHGCIQAVDGLTTVSCELIPEADRSLPTEGFEDRLEAIVRRAVVEHCLYGVDKDPLAVELARVALWVETLDRDLPFTFLDHKLRCGDSLVGTWLDRFRDYPLLAFDRQSPDRKWKGVNHPADLWHKALRERRGEAIEQQVGLLNKQTRIPYQVTSDEELKQAVERLRRLYRELRAVPAGRPDERARIWRTRIQADQAIVRVRQAFDTWCSLWFWPLDKLSSLPLPRELHTPSEAALEVVQELRDQQRFLHWELEFPDVFTAEGAGFDAVVGNPPWETQKPLSQEFFSNRDPMYRTYGKQAALRVQRALFHSRPEIENRWLAYVGDLKDRGNFVRHSAEPYGDGKGADHDGGTITLARGRAGTALHRSWRTKRGRFTGHCDPAHPFRHQGSADLNTYKMFLELGHALLRDGGELGLVLPSGVYSDKGASGLRALLLDHCLWRALYVFQNERKFFRDVHHSQKQCVVLARKGGRTDELQAVFKLGPSDSPEAEDIPLQLRQAWTPLILGRELIERFSPDTRSILEFASARDLSILSKIYQDAVAVGDHGPDTWDVVYAREFDMTNDSELFVPGDKAESSGFQPDIYGRWSNGRGEVLLPLYEGRMIGQFDFSAKRWIRGKGRTAVWETVEWDSKAIHPSYLLPSKHFTSPAPMKLHVMDVTSSINSRTAVGALIPGYPGGHKTPRLHSRRRPGCFAAVFNSWVYDAMLRGRLSSLSLTLHVLHATALPRRVHPEVERHLEMLALRLSGVHESFATAWIGSQTVRHPWRRLWAITPHERLRLRSAVDAVVAVLYGIDRSDLSWLLKDCDHPATRLSDKAFCRLLDPKGFWRVDKTGAPELRHAVLSLAAFDDVLAAIAAAGDRDAGIQAFCEQHDGDGWMLPETLCISDLGLTRAVDVGAYDERARSPQPVRSRMGPRFLDWQLEQSVDESWAECERHAKAIMEGTPAPPVAQHVAEAASDKQETDQQKLF